MADPIPAKAAAAPPPTRVLPPVLRPVLHRREDPEVEHVRMDMPILAA